MVQPDDDDKAEDNAEESSLEEHYRYQLVPVEAGQTWVLDIKQGMEYSCTSIPCHHRIDCLGYSITCRNTRVLLPEYRSLTGPEIGQLRQNGVEIYGTGPVEPVLTWLGDTTHTVFENIDWTSSKALVVECTYLDDDDAARAQHTQHMHWNELRPVIEQHPDTLFVLIHFSLKHSQLCLRQTFRPYRNIHPVLIQEQIEEEWNKSGENEPAPVCNCFLCNP
jgi:ribonuclease BN (tRNA processing enzyme)